MNRDEAKSILLLYRSHADAADPQVAEALALAKQDPELARWLEAHSARQETLRTTLREIVPPAGLKEQIVSEQAARSKTKSRRDAMVATVALVAIAVAVTFMARSWTTRNKYEDVPNTFANYQGRMITIASAAYAMELATNDLAQIQSFLAQKQAPADYTLPVALQKTPATGCAIENWDGRKVSMICFSTGKPLPANQPGDLWLFVADRASVKDATTATSPQFNKVGRIITATWTRGDKLYLLGTEGDEEAIRKYL
jgi:hypothetical protein